MASRLFERSFNVRCPASLVELDKLKVLGAFPKAARRFRAFERKESIMDFAALATSLGTVVTSAITASIPVVTIVLGAMIGYRVFKRFVKG